MVDRRYVIAAALLAATLGASFTAAAATNKGGTPVAQQKWLTLTGFWPLGTGTSVVGAAAGRGWIGFAKDESHTTLGSIGSIGGRLSFAKTSLAARSPMMIVGSQLIYHLSDGSGTPGPLRAVALLSDGRVGTPRAVADDPEGIPPQQLDPVVTGALDVGDRIVWILSGAKMSESGGVRRSYLWACCTSAGELTELTRYVKQGRPSLFMQLGVDGKKRPWLAWLESSGGAVLGPVKLLELDPKTLVPRTSSAVVPPGGSTAIDFRLACASACRVVLSDLFSGDVRSAAPGERSPPKMASGTREAPADLLDATARAGHVTSGSITLRQRSPTKAAPFVVEVFRGDSRGSHARLAGSVDLPSTINPLDFDHYATYQFSEGIFVPAGLVYFAMYNPRDTKTRVLAGMIPG